MQRPDTPDGLFHAGNPATGVKGTPITAEWLNALLGISTLFRGNTEPPAPELGDDGDFYICTPTRNMYGPKTAGAWGDAWVQGLPGPKGDPGDPGIQGIPGAAGGGTLDVGITIDGAGSVITTGGKGFRSLPVGAIVVGWRVIADRAGSIEFDVKMGVAQNFPDTMSITGTARPALVDQQFAESTELTGWTIDLPGEAIIEFEVLSAATVQRVTLSLTIITVPSQPV